MNGPGGRSVCFGQWFTEAEARTIRRAARRASMEPSEWIRAQALNATRRARPPAVAVATLTADPGDFLEKLKAEMLAAMPHDLGGRAHPEHDRDRCLECLSMRVQKLVRRGLRPQLARDLRDAGTMAAAMIAAFEESTPEQLNAVNAAHVRARKSVDRLVTPGDDGRNTPTTPN